MPAPNPSLLDQQQILQRVFDEANGRLRTDATMSSGGGDVEVAIDHTTDSIRLGDGTDYITSTTEGSKTAIDVSLLPSSNPLATTPTIVNVAAASAGTEYNYTFTADTRKVFMQSRKGNIQFSFQSGMSGITYISLDFGNSYYVENVNLNSITVYFQSDKPGDTLEIHTWA